MDCRGCGTHVTGPPPLASINQAVDEILRSSIDDAVKRGGVCPLCGHAKATPFWNRKDVYIAIPIACLTLFLVALAIVNHYHAAADSPVADIALAKVRGNPEMVELLGTPIEAGYFTIGKVQQDETGWTETKLTIPIHGPKGKATVRVIAGRAEGPWTFSTLEVMVEEQTKPINLVRGTLDMLQNPSYKVVHFQPAAAAEIMPFSTTKPAWDGSFPYMTVNLAGFQSAITTEGPTFLHNSPVNESRVQLEWGKFSLRQTDFFAAGDLPLDVTRNYQVWVPQPAAFGMGANHPFDLCPYGSRNPYTYLFLILADGTKVDFERISKGTGYADAVYRHSGTASEFYGSQIAWNGRGWTLKFADGREALFPDSYHGKSASQGAPVEIHDEHGNRIQLIRDGRRNLRRLLSSNGHYVDFWYDGSNRVTEARDDAGNVRRYTYGLLNQHLSSISDASGVVYQFEYALYLQPSQYDNFLMTSIRDGRGNELLHNEYADHTHISRQTFANGDVYEYEYDFDSSGRSSRTVVTLPGGQRKEISFPQTDL